MGQALYRKYRSKTFDEVVGQNHITKTLKEAISKGKISHAYLFTGPRGTGKTSIARIVAHEVNGLSYDEKALNLDIIEIDAASNRRIDEIRDLREKVHIAPTSAKYKIYIIDEVHMLTREAFNALLKTLEEPPAHVIFILATTEAHKLPETIISRTQRYNFRPVESSIVAAHLKTIAKKEQISITPEALEIIAQHGQGSFRDSISMLDQLSSSGDTISEAEVRNVLGIAPENSISDLLIAVETGNNAAVIDILTGLSAQGVDAAKIALQLAAELRKKLITKEGKGVWMVPLLRELFMVPSRPDPRNHLEISLLEASSATDSGSHPGNHKNKTTVKKTDQAAPKKAATVIQPVSSAIKYSDFSLDIWSAITDKIKDQAASLYTALRLATPQVDEGSLILLFEFPLHQKKVNQAKHIKIIGDTIEEMTGAKLKVRCEVDKSIAKKQFEPEIKPVTPEVEPNDDSSMNIISNIFGQPEVLES
jgi:DNA polymerase III subunit gamma/tau